MCQQTNTAKLNWLLYIVGNYGIIQHSLSDRTCMCCVVRVPYRLQSNSRFGWVDAHNIQFCGCLQMQHWVWIVTQRSKLTSGVVIGGGGGGVRVGQAPCQWKNCQKWGKRGGKSGKKERKRGKIRKKRHKPGRVLFCPSWQIGLAEPLKLTLGMNSGRIQLQSISLPQESSFVVLRQLICRTDEICVQWGW